MREKGRPAIYGMAALYLFYLAYQMFGARLENGGADYMLMLVFSGIFVLAGISLLVISFFMLRKKPDGAASKGQEITENTETAEEQK